MASAPQQIPFDSPDWAALPSSNNVVHNAKDINDLLLRAEGGDWKVTPTTSKIDGPTWGFWRAPEPEGFEVSTIVRMSGSNYLS